MSEKIKLEVGRIYRSKDNPIKQRKKVLALTDEWVVYTDTTDDTEGEGTMVRHIAEDLWIEVNLPKSFMVYEMIGEEGEVYLGDASGEELNFDSENQTGNSAPHLKIGRSWMFEPSTRTLIYQGDTNQSLSMRDIFRNSPPPLTMPMIQPLVPGYIPSQPGFNPGEVICTSTTVNEDALNRAIQELAE